MEKKTIHEIYNDAHTYAENDLIPNKGSTLQAMELYAKQEAIAFARFAMVLKFVMALEGGVKFDDLEKIYDMYKADSIIMF